MEWGKLLVAAVVALTHYLRDTPVEGPSTELLTCRVEVSSLSERVGWYQSLCQIQLCFIVFLIGALKRSRTVVVGKPCPVEVNVDNRVQHNSVLNSAPPVVQGGATPDLLLDQALVVSEGKPKLAEGFVLTPSAKRKLALKA